MKHVVFVHRQQVAGSCRQCGGPIVERYYLRALGEAWHIGGCLRCVSCLASLDSQRSCFVRAGLIYCRTDYQRSVGFPTLCRADRENFDHSIISSVLLPVAFYPTSYTTRTERCVLQNDFLFCVFYTVIIQPSGRLQ